MFRQKCVAPVASIAEYESFCVIAIQTRPGPENRESTGQNPVQSNAFDAGSQGGNDKDKTSVLIVWVGGTGFEPVTSCL